MARRTPAGFSVLHVLTGTVTLLRSKWRTVSVALLSFSLLAAVTGVIIDREVGRIEDRIASFSSSSWEEVRISVDERFQKLDQADAMLMLTQMKAWRALSEGQKSHMTREVAVIAFMVSVWPWLLLSVLSNSVVAFLASVFFLLLAISGSESAYDTARRVPLMALKMAGLCIWMLVRSFLWVPFIGPLLFIILLPRLALSPVILAASGGGIFASIRLSMKQTRGRWFSVFSALFVAGFACLALLWVGIVLAAIIALFSAKLSFFFFLVLLLLLNAFQMFFLAMLSTEVE